MFKKAVAIVLFLACVPFVARASDADNSSTPPGGGTAAGSADKSFFQGVWTGEWSGFIEATMRQEATVEIGPEIRDGVFTVVYSWGEASFRSRTVFPGKVKSEGTIQGDSFLFSWKNKQGRKFDLTLNKLEDGKAKGRLERGGPLGPMEKPYSEAVFRKK